MTRPPLPPFTVESAAQKARLAEDAWNTRDPAKVALAYSVDSIWRNRAEFIRGREAIEAFLIRKWISRAGVSADQGGLGVSRQPDSRALCI